MAGLWQQLSSLRRGLALALLHFILYLPSSIFAVDAKVSQPSLEQFQVVRGNFSRFFLRVGYHKITEIPSGARNISVQETVKSRNYLALQTKSGVSILNGNWVIDRPGVLTAAGTQLAYKRPNEIRSRSGESITAPGPLTEDVHVYLIYQQPGPRVYYEYSVPLPKVQTTPEPAAPSYTPLLADQNRTRAEGGWRNPWNSKRSAKSMAMSEITPYITTVVQSNSSEEVHENITKEKPHPNQVPSEPSLEPEQEPKPAYTWTKSGHTECSTTCGTGRRHVLWECVEKDSQETVASDLCDSALQPSHQEEDCSIQPCPAYWDVGEWSECSRKCGPGTQHRQVICRQVTHVHTNKTENLVVVAPELCGLSDRPVTKSTCQLRICSQWEIRSEWSPCSVPCGVGQRSREVVCLSNQGEVEEDEECNMNLKPDTLQNCDMGACARSWFTSLWSQRCSAECGQGNRTRTTVCLMNHVTDLPLDSCEGEHPAEVTSCDSGPCQSRLEWYTGPWGQCSTECGNGTQTRSVACIFNDNDHMEVVDPSKCSSLPQPATARPCRLKPCGVQWYVTEWSTCSRSCNGGYRVREVRCLTDNITPSELCDPSLTPESREECNQQPCLAEISECGKQSCAAAKPFETVCYPACSDQYHNCMVVVQARLCIYPYYRGVCCASCSRAQQSYPHSFQKHHIRR